MVMLNKNEILVTCNIGVVNVLSEITIYINPWNNYDYVIVKVLTDIWFLVRRNR